MGQQRGEAYLLGHCNQVPQIWAKTKCHGQVRFEWGLAAFELVLWYLRAKGGNAPDTARLARLGAAADGDAPDAAATADPAARL